MMKNLYFLPLFSIALLLASSLLWAAPYPQSDYIKGIIWKNNTYKKLANGSDNFPVTWADNDKQYTSWGDGGGFGGSRVSWGVAEITGDYNNFTGKNIVASNSHTNGGKSYGMLFIGSALYQWYGPGSCGPYSDYTKLSKSTDYGKTWQAAGWSFTKSDRIFNGTILNFGKSYAGARDNYVYHYFIADAGGCQVTKPGKILLARVPKDKIMERNQYEFFAGMNGSNPTWTTSLANKQPVFYDPNGVGWALSASYNAGLRRYILVTENTVTFQSKFGYFEAKEPWGPWKTIAYNPSFNYSSGFFGNFSNKWTSADGKRSVFIFTGVGSLDSWNSLEVEFVIGITDNTPPTAPSNLSATAKSESQIDLSWNNSTDAESGIGEYLIYRDGSKVGTAGSTSYSDQGLSENTQYTYQVSAVNGAGLEGTKSNTVSVTTAADNTPPVLASADAISETGVKIVFSEPVEAASAQNPINYTLDNNISVSNAALGADLKTVTLAVSALTMDITYTLTVNNVKDRAKSPNTIQNDSKTTFVYEGIIVISDLNIASGKAYAWDTMAVGKEVYIDRSYTYSSVPKTYEGMVYLKTANDDKTNQGNPMINFTVNQEVSVYVGYAGSAPPSWLSGWQNTGEDLVTTDRTLKVYTKVFSAGQVELGPNDAPSMYTVVVGKSSGPSTESMLYRNPDGDFGIIVSPNPVNSTTNLKLADCKGQIANCKLQIFDISGRLVEEIFYSANRSNIIKWDARPYSSGLYILKARIHDRVFCRHVVLMK